ncbi:MAG: hypothetical protein J6U23_05695 [Clostridiales bacterium]|nr:hypothetical protein [Clostridiales bacterium]
MRKTTIMIDGGKLRTILETKTGKSIYDISSENGFARNFLNEACRNNKASNIVQAVVRLYGIEPEEYIFKEPEEEPKEFKQISFDDLEEERAKLKEENELLKENLSKANEELSKLLQNEKEVKRLADEVEVGRKANLEYKEDLKKKALRLEKARSSIFKLSSIITKAIEDYKNFKF